MRHLNLLPLLFVLGCGSAANDLTEAPLFTPVETGGSSTGGAAAETGGSSTGGMITISTGGTTGGSPSTGGSKATGGTGTGGLTGGATGGVSTGGALATGGSPTTGGTVSTGGMTSTGGTVSTGGSATGGKANLCEPPNTLKSYAIGDVVSTFNNNKNFYSCVKPGCQGTDLETADATDARWIRIACDSACQSCSFNCNAPIAGVMSVGSVRLPYTDYPEYLAAAEPGWQVRVNSADGCNNSGVKDGSNCAYETGFKLVKCTGTAEECRANDPRYENCSPMSVAGRSAPCRDTLLRPLPAWTVVTTCT